VLGYEPRVSLEEGVRMMVDVRWTTFLFVFSIIFPIPIFLVVEGKRRTRTYGGDGIEKGAIGFTLSISTRRSQ